MPNPTLYRAAYCDMLVNFPTFAAFTRHIGVSPKSVYRWRRSQPKFAEAVKAMTRQHPNSAYRAAFCDEVVDFLKDGHSLTAFAGHVGVCRKTLRRWMDEHPAFAEAVARAKALSALWWEKRILDLAQTGQGNASAIIFGLKNRVSEEWRDKVHTELTGQVEQVHRIERRIVRIDHSDG